MKIYRVVAYDNAHAYYHFGTRKEADAKRRELLSEYRDSEWPDAEINIEVDEVEPTKKGIARALQDLVDVTCMNEH